VAAATAGSVVSELVGQGDGTFTVTDLPSANTQGLAAGDFNQDGWVDVVVGSDAYQGVGVLTLSPSGALVGTWTENTTDAPHSLATADINEDGLLDLVVGDEINGARVLWGQPGGTLSPPVAISGLATLGHESLVATGDFNGDGHIDVVLTTSVYGETTILFGDGTGALQAPHAMAYMATGVGSFLVTDLNGDGKDDLVFGSNPCCQVGLVDLYLSNGDGTFHTGERYDVTQVPVKMAVRDMDGDGVPDLVVAGSAGHSLEILRGKGGGTFDPSIALFWGQEVRDVVVDDFNQDCLPDLAVDRAGVDGVEIYFGH
jgi:hypothetical protein